MALKTGQTVQERTMGLTFKLVLTVQPFNRTA